MKELPLVVILTLSGIVVGTSAVSVGYAPVSGVSLDAVPSDLISVQSIRLNLSNGGVRGATVTLVNNDTSDHDGRVTVRLRTDNGQSRSSEATFFVGKRGFSVDCKLGFEEVTPHTELRVVHVRVNTTVAVDKRQADCRTRGRGRGRGGQGGTN